MRRKILIAVSTLSVIAAVTASLDAHAESGIKSKGNFVLESGEMAIYAEDIDYLQDELDVLFGELPALSDND